MDNKSNTIKVKSAKVALGTFQITPDGVSVSGTGHGAAVKRIAKTNDASKACKLYSYGVQIRAILVALGSLANAAVDKIMLDALDACGMVNKGKATSTGKIARAIVRLFAAMPVETQLQALACNTRKEWFAAVGYATDNADPRVKALTGVVKVGKSLADTDTVKASLDTLVAEIKGLSGGALEVVFGDVMVEIRASVARDKARTVAAKKANAPRRRKTTAKNAAKVAA